MSALLIQPGWDSEMEEQRVGKYEAGQIAEARSWKALKEAANEPEFHLANDKESQVMFW